MSLDHRLGLADQRENVKVKPTCRTRVRVEEVREGHWGTLPGRNNRKDLDRRKTKREKRHLVFL